MDGKVGRLYTLIKFPRSKMIFWGDFQKYRYSLMSFRYIQLIPGGTVGWAVEVRPVLVRGQNWISVHAEGPKHILVPRAPVTTYKPRCHRNT